MDFNKKPCKKNRKKGNKGRQIGGHLRRAKKAAIAAGAQRFVTLANMDATNTAHQRNVASVKAIIDLIEDAVKESDNATFDVQEEAIRRHRS